MTILSDHHHPPPPHHSSPSPRPPSGSPLPSSSYSTFSTFDPPGGSFDGSSSLEVSRPFLRLESYSFSDHTSSSDGEPSPPLVAAAAHRRIDSVSSSSVSTSVEPGGRGGVTRTPLPSRDIFDVQEVGDSQDDDAQEEEDSDLESQSQGHHRRSSSSSHLDDQPPPRFVITGCSPRNGSNSILSPPSLIGSPSWPSPFDDAEDDHDYDQTLVSLPTPLTPRPRPSSWSQPVPPPRTSSRANLRSFSTAQQQHQQQPQGQPQHQRHGSEHQRSRRPLTPYPGYGCTTTAMSEDMAASTNRSSAAATATATPADPMVARTLDLLKPSSPVNVPEHWPWCGAAAAASSTIPWSSSSSPGLQQRRRSPPASASASAAAAAAALSPNVMATREEQAASSQLWSHPNPFADVDAWQDRHPHAQAQDTREHMHSPLESETATLTDSLAPAQQAAAAHAHGYPPAGPHHDQDQPPARLPASSSSTRDRLRWYYDRVMHPRRSSTMNPTTVTTTSAAPQPQHNRYDSTNTLLGGKVSTEGTVRARPTTGGTNWLNGYHSLATTAAYPPTTHAPSPDVTSGGMLSYEEALRRNQRAERGGGHGGRRGAHKAAGAGGAAGGAEDEGKPIVREQRRRLSASLWPRSLLHSTASSTSLSDESDWDSQCGVGESYDEYATGAQGASSPQPGYGHGHGYSHAAAAAATPSLAGLTGPPLLTPGIPSYHLLLHHLVSQWDETLLYLESSHLHTFDSPSTPRVISRFLVFRLPPITLFILLASFFIYICFRYEVPPALYGLMGSITVGAMAWATFACQRGEENMDKEREGEARLLRQRWLKGKVRERRRRRRGERGRIKEVDKACRRAAMVAAAQQSAQAVAKAEEEAQARDEEKMRHDHRGGAAARQASRPPRPRPRTSQSAPPLHGAWATTGTRGILTSPSNANTVRNTSAAGQPTVGFALPNSPQHVAQQLQQQQRRTSGSGLGGAAVGLGRASMNPWAGGAATRQSSGQYPQQGQHPLDNSGRFDEAEEDEESTTVEDSTDASNDVDQHPAFLTSFDETTSQADLSLSQRRDWIERWAREASFAPLWAPPSVRQGLSGAMQAVQVQRAESASSRAASGALTAAAVGPPATANATATAAAAATAAGAATAVASAVVMTVPNPAAPQRASVVATPTPTSGALTTPTITTGTAPTMTMSGTPPTSSSAAARRPLLPPPTSSQHRQLRSTAGSSVMRSHAGNGGGGGSHVGSTAGAGGGAGANRRRPRAGSRSIVVAGAAATVAAGAAAGASAVAWQGGGGGAGGGMWGGGGGAGGAAGGFAGAI